MTGTGGGAVLAVDEAGNELTRFDRVAEQDLTSADAAAGGLDGPLTAALVAVWAGERLLMVYDRFRDEWELPGGMIDPGESPRDAAERELLEETGLAISDLAFVGRARFVLGAERRVEYLALYTAEADAHMAPDGTGPVADPVSTFVPNDEIAALAWWHGPGSLEGRVQPLDVTLGRIARRATPPAP